MPNKIGQMPGFAGEETEKIAEEGKIDKIEATPDSGVEPQAEEPVVKEKETPSEPPAEEEPTKAVESQPSDNTGTLPDLRKQFIDEIDGLKEARLELIDEIKDLRGQRREAKQAELKAVDQEIDKLEDVNPNDVQIVERIIRAKGFISRDESRQMLAQSKRDDEITKFFKEFPEYGTVENPTTKWDNLKQEISLYKEPQDPAQWGKLLRRAHSMIRGTQVSSDRTVAIKKRQAEIAGVGSGGIQRSSSVKPFTDKQRLFYESGGWSEEEIKAMEERSNTI